MQQAMNLLLVLLWACSATAFRSSRNSTSSLRVAKTPTNPSWACQLNDRPSILRTAGTAADTALKLNAADTNSQYVKAVDASSLSAMIRATEADLLIVFYAPWCPHCQTYVMHDENGKADKAPLELLARDLAPNKGVKVLKYDINEHKPPVGFALEHVPTIFFKPRQRANPVAFQGDPHDLAGLKEWVLQGGPEPAPMASPQVVVLASKSRNSTTEFLAKSTVSPSWACPLKDRPQELHAAGIAADAALKLHARAADTNSQYVKAVDATSLSAMIGAAEADLLIVFFAPWCPHCQTYVMHDANGNADKAPLVLLAKELAPNKGVKVLKYDINENKPPVGFPLEHVPTIFFKSRQRANPVAFQGDPHDLAGLKEWVLQGGPEPAPMASPQVVVLATKSKA